MSNLLNKKCKLCRREGKKLFLKDSRCYSQKCPLEKRGAVPPGAHGQRRSRKPSDYSIQLREKQKVKRIYKINEAQMKIYFLMAKTRIAKRKDEKGGAGDQLLKLLEMRLDNVLFRSGLVTSRSIARQTVGHQHVLVDGRRINIPSYQLKLNQVVSLSPKALEMPAVKEALEKKIAPPKWLEKKGPAAKVIRAPTREEIDPDINEQLIIEFYSR